MVSAMAIAVALGGRYGADPKRAEPATPPSSTAVATPESATARGPQGRVPQFVVECVYSHSAPDDPIVHPGEPGRSHLHDFFGNTTTDAFSTAESLRGADTTCPNQADTAAYWAPALYDAGEPVTPVRADAYYRPAPGVDPATLAAYPDGLMMIGGDQTAAEPQSTDVVAWACGSSPEVSTTPPTCPDGAPLHVRVVFPDCWDGRSTDSDDHLSHMARSRGGECPASHPVALPQLLLAIEYPVTGPGHDLELASGGLLTGHADFVNAWDPDRLAREVESCLNRGVVCGVVSRRDV